MPSPYLEGRGPWGMLIRAAVWDPLPSSAQGYLPCWLRPGSSRVARRSRVFSFLGRRRTERWLSSGRTTKDGCSTANAEGVFSIICIWNGEDRLSLVSQRTDGLSAVLTCETVF